MSYRLDFQKTNSGSFCELEIRRNGRKMHEGAIVALVQMRNEEIGTRGSKGGKRGNPRTSDCQGEELEEIGIWENMAPLPNEEKNVKEKMGHVGPKFPQNNLQASVRPDKAET